MKILDYRADGRAVARLAERRLEPDPTIETRVREIVARLYYRAAGYF